MAFVHDDEKETFGEEEDLVDRLALANIEAVEVEVWQFLEFVGG